MKLAEMYFFMRHTTNEKMRNRMKMMIRSLDRKPSRKRSIYFPDGLSRIDVIRAPKEISDFAKADEWFYDYEYMPFCERSTFQDCTGMPFTVWHKTVETSAGFKIYHRISVDI